MKKILFVFCLVLAFGYLNAQNNYQKYAVGFYNLENLFDTKHDEGKNDDDFLPDGSYHWTDEKYQNKLGNMSKVLSEMATDVLKDGCAVIGVSEVENRSCLEDLVSMPALKENNFKFAHQEGLDARGVDCALLYNPKYFELKDVKLVPYVYELPEDSLKATRGFLIVSGMLANENVSFIVCHLPSRFSTSYYRELGARQVNRLKDSLMKNNPKVKLIVMGDMNDDPFDKSISCELRGKRDIGQVGKKDMYNPWWSIIDGGTGTLLYRGKWNLFDQILISPSLISKIDNPKNYKTLKYDSCQIFRRDYLFQESGKYKGNLKRTHAGGNYLNGYSDHLPTIIYLKKEE